MGFLDRFRRSLDWLQPKPQPQADPFWNWLYTHPDSYSAVLSTRRDPDWRHRMQVGLAGGAWRHTDPRTHTLTTGPAQGEAGKTSAMLIPTVLSHYGPCLATTSKFDIAQATAMARSRLGDVYWYDPAGGPTPPGFKELRFSPIVGAENWTHAREIARQMMEASSGDVNKGATVNEVSHHFQIRSGDFLSVLLHVAAVLGSDMGWVVSIVTAMDVRQDGELIQLERRMLSGEIAVSPRAREVLTGILNTEARERAGTFTTLAVALRAYQGDALRVARDVNFDPLQFVVGRPDDPADLYLEPRGDKQQMLANMGILPRLPGRYDTIYVCLPNDKQQVYAPLLVILVDAIRRATYTVAAHDQRHGVYGRMPVLLALDEMYGCPIPSLPTWLADASSQGLLMCGALQDLSQAEARWGTAGKGFLTLWQNIVVMRGIRHADTINLLSMLSGEYDHTKSTYSENRSAIVGSQWSESLSSERRRRLPPEIISGGDPNRPGEELIFTPGGKWQYFKPIRYFSGVWPWILTQSAEWALKGPAQNWVLPLPDLARGGDYRALHAAGGDVLVRWFQEVQQQWREQNQQRRIEAG
jgi:type IV secretory pathway TraG/TraD family ATPase VirD4